ncbi:MAG: low molecular weight phosphotyrosine protein phosphatase [Prevotellaceae bacterium]|jgi:protein-tyrosine phosphatase|nr:low molecular weight phosphotyrosine protein phosphatase [Prevotellaceae bacterium]
METEKYYILFVCLGNICRSPAAESIFRAMVTQRGLAACFEIDSACTYAGNSGQMPDLRMKAAAKRRGYSLAHIARPVRCSDFGLFDKILVMDDANYNDVCRLAPDVNTMQKVVRIADYCRRHKVALVPDPYNGSSADFDHVLDILEDACTNLLAEWLKNNDC